MAEVILTPGTLAEPACGYANEQERLEAYTAAIIATLLGGIEWQASVDPPTDLTLHWMKLDANGRPVAILEYSDADARYVRLLSIPAVDGIAAGAGNAYTLGFTPSFTTATANEAQRRFTFTANHTNTGAATLNVDGLGAVPIVKHNGDALAANDIVANQVVDVVISGGNAWLQSPPAPPTVTQTAAVFKYSGVTNTAAQVVPTAAETDVEWNTEDDPDGIATLALNQVTLATGTYLFDIYVPINFTSAGSDSHVLALYDITGAVVLATATELTGDDDDQISLHLKHMVKITAASNIYQVRVYSSVGAGVTLGNPANIAPYAETYQQWSIIKLA